MFKRTILAASAIAILFAPFSAIAAGYEPPPGSPPELNLFTSIVLYHHLARSAPNLEEMIRAEYAIENSRPLPADPFERHDAEARLASVVQEKLAATERALRSQRVWSWIPGSSCFPDLALCSAFDVRIGQYNFSTGVQPLIIYAQSMSLPEVWGQSGGTQVSLMRQATQVNMKLPAEQARALYEQFGNNGTHCAITYQPYAIASPAGGSDRTIIAKVLQVHMLDREGNVVLSFALGR